MRTLIGCTEYLGEMDNLRNEALNGSVRVSLSCWYHGSWLVS